MFAEESPELLQCDVLFVDSKFHRDFWVERADYICERFAHYAKSVKKVIYFDTVDSSGSVNPEILPYVTSYCKSQVLLDRTKYLRPMYGHRPYTDFYHRNDGICDSIDDYSTPVDDPDQLQKLRVSWNSGLADYSMWGVYRMALYAKWPIRRLLCFSDPIARPSFKRSRGFSCRMGIDYPRATVRWQREQIRKLLEHRLDTKKLNRRQYFQELTNSYVVVSPFGYGEITLKDFEVFLTGGILLKPDMSHMETWPNLFEDQVTMMSHRWDLSNFLEILNELTGDPRRHIDVAQVAQERYFKHTRGPEAGPLFVSHFKSLIGP